MNVLSTGQRIRMIRFYYNWFVNDFRRPGDKIPAYGTVKKSLKAAARVFLKPCERIWLDTTTRKWVGCANMKSQVTVTRTLNLMALFTLDESRLWSLFFLDVNNFRTLYCLYKSQAWNTNMPEKMFPISGVRNLEMSRLAFLRQ